jgi:hypothetical protein
MLLDNTFIGRRLRPGALGKPRRNYDDNPSTLTKRSYSSDLPEPGLPATSDDRETLLTTKPAPTKGTY